MRTSLHHFFAHSTRYIALLTSILIFGLIVHFVALNFFQFVIGAPKILTTVFALWKEIVIGLLVMFVIGYNLTAFGARWWWKMIQKDTFFFRVLLGFMILVAVTLFASVINSSITHYLISFRYNFVAFVLLLLGYQIAQIISYADIKYLTRRYILIIRWVVWFGLLRYFILGSLPWALKIIGYDRHVYEGTIGERPPAVYYAALDHGAPRNQFLWERPIFYGFYLVAFRPLFFLLYLRKAPKTEALFFGALYILNVFSTFSRSARGVWFLETILLLLILYGKVAIRYFKYLLIPLAVGWFLVSTYFYYEIFGPWRNFSNTGHINAFYKAMDILKIHRLWGLGAWTAGPASHQLGIGFNPENQYLQIWIEYGIFGFLVRIIFYAYLNISWIIRRWRGSVKTYFQDSDVLHRDNQRLVLLSCNIGLIWLSLCGLVLHSLADKMVIRPFMILYGLRLGTKR